MVIVETTVFTRQVQALLSDEAYRGLQTEIISRPEAGVLIPGGGGLRKLRWSYQGHGKRGGLRLVYYWAVHQEEILMLYLYPKNVQDNLSPTHLKMLRQLVRSEYP